jgi:hypothetical protein
VNESRDVHEAARDIACEREILRARERERDGAQVREQNTGAVMAGESITEMRGDSELHGTCHSSIPSTVS